jgi:AMMECR1 domain-containing protein
MNKSHENFYEHNKQETNMNLSKSKSKTYINAFDDFKSELLCQYEHPLVQKLIAVFTDEQKEKIEYLNNLCRPECLTDDKVSYEILSVYEFESLVRTLADLLCEKKAASDLLGPSIKSSRKFRAMLNSGELLRRIHREANVLKSIDVESQSLIYQFRRTVRHNKTQYTYPKTMEVLRAIRRELRYAEWS